MLKWFLLLPLNLLGPIVSLFLAPILVLFATKENKLPKWLSYFDTPDNYLDGDDGYKNEHAPYKGVGRVGWERYANRVMWLWRNPAYGLDWTVLAFKPEQGCTLKVLGTRTIDGKKVHDNVALVTGNLNYDGWFAAKLTNPDGSYIWQLYITHHWNATKTTKLNFGWKIWMAPGVCSYVFSFTGFWKTI